MILKIPHLASFFVLVTGPRSPAPLPRLRPSPFAGPRSGPPPSVPIPRTRTPMRPVSRSRPTPRFRPRPRSRERRSVGRSDAGRHDAAEHPDERIDGRRDEALRLLHLGHGLFDFALNGLGALRLRFRDCLRKKLRLEGAQNSVLLVLRSFIT